MDTPAVIKQPDPADVLVEFVEALASIEVTPEKLAKNATTMIGDDGETITY